VWLLNIKTMSKKNKKSVTKWLPLVFILCLVGLLTWSWKVNSKEVSTSVSAQKKTEVSVYESLTEATNSEGNLKLTGTSRRSVEGRVAYAFKVVDDQKKTEVPLYETIADPGSTISIPRNSWSPDYKQVFIKTTSPEGENYYLFRANGESYGNGEKYIVIGNYWEKSKIEGSIKEISGWAGDDLLMTYTVNKDGSRGLAYWFVTSSRKFMQVREF
jgi:hypothetical protein